MAKHDCKLPNSFKGIHCEIIGFGISNQALAEFLLNEGAKVTVRDKQPPPSEYSEILKASECDCIFGEDYLSNIQGEYIFRSPSVRPDLSEITEAIKNGATLTSEWELFFDRVSSRVIGITGSDGKTTTATITSIILSECYKKSDIKIYTAGNIGVPLISILNKLKRNDIVVAELSSFQLMTIKKVPPISALTNITPNHLDWHKNSEEYFEAKQKIASLGCRYLSLPDNNIGKIISTTARKNGAKVSYRGRNKKRQIYCDDKKIFLKNRPILDLSDILIKGKHNAENYMTAISLCEKVYCNGDKNKLQTLIEATRFVAKSFSGVKHRITKIAEKNGIKYYDSSIDSTPSRTAVTLKCFNKPLTVICGGYDKNLDYAILASALNKYATAVIVTGMSADKILTAIIAEKNRTFTLVHEKDFENAVSLASKLTPKNGSVLLSPACASFDSFANYKQRAEAFSEIVASITD